MVSRPVMPPVTVRNRATFRGIPHVRALGRLVRTGAAPISIIHDETESWCVLAPSPRDADSAVGLVLC